jgi:hypothetical protein
VEEEAAHFCDRKIAQQVVYQCLQQNSKLLILNKLLVDQNRGRPSLIAEFFVGVTKLLITYNILEPAYASLSIYPKWPAEAGRRQLKNYIVEDCLNDKSMMCHCAYVRFKYSKVSHTLLYMMNI